MTFRLWRCFILRTITYGDERIFRFSQMEDYVKLLCQELVVELAEAALNNSNSLAKAVAQTPPTADPVAAGPTLLSPTSYQLAFPEPKTEGPLKPQFFSKRPAGASQLPQAKVKIRLPSRNF